MISAMNLFNLLVLAFFVLALLAGLARQERRSADRPRPLLGADTASDRDLARLDDELRAVGSAGTTTTQHRVLPHSHSGESQRRPKRPLRTVMP
jgi:hypothetical protein